MSGAVRVRAAHLTILAALVLSPGQVEGQLISPGKLSSPHAELEGVRNCTRCHELRRKGVSASLCLDCHEPLARRYDAREGFHATLAEKDCAACHKEHFGTDFALVKLDTASFDHGRTGYELEGAHGATACRDCHRAERIVERDVLAYGREHGALGRTFLGLPSDCATCHEADSPHGGEFDGRACTDCHLQDTWDDADAFDHARTSYALTGAHARAPCSGCHQGKGVDGSGPDDAVPRYTGVDASSCASCHDDVHRGAMPGRCERCHSTSGWRSVDRRRVESTFDHRVTGFLLEGSHASTPCASCHDAAAAAKLDAMRIRFQRGTSRRTFPHPLADTCASCHVDSHEPLGSGPEGASTCDACHSQDSWLPSAYDVERHNRESSFALLGAHVVVACESCHRPAERTLAFRLEAKSCFDCHAASSPHGSQFEGRACAECHVVESFRAVDFDHAGTRFPLDGAHDDLPCASCHTAEDPGGGEPVVRYRPLGTACRDCHGGTT